MPYRGTGFILFLVPQLFYVFSYVVICFRMPQKTVHGSNILSLTSFFQGYTTMQLTCSQEMHNLGYAWKSINEQLGNEFESHIYRMTFLKSRTVSTHKHVHLGRDPKCNLLMMFRVTRTSATA